MRTDFEKEQLALKFQANVINNRGMALLLAAELIQEYRGLVQQLLARNEKLLTALNEKENPKRDGGAVPAAPPQTT